MKKIILAALVSAFVAAPLVACDYHKEEGKETKASLSTDKTKVKASAKTKAAKTVASAQTKKAKI